METLIDGYNLLFASDVFVAKDEPATLHNSRMALLDRLIALVPARLIPRTVVVFDARTAPPGLPRELSHRGLQVKFPRPGHDADELIETLLETCGDPKRVTLVSSDHRLQRAARRVGATSVDSDKWWQARTVELRRANSPDRSAPEKPDQATADEAKRLLAELGEIPRDPTRGPPSGKQTTNERIFPPGYFDGLDAD